MVIDTVFENGDFRPLTPVAIPENKPVKIRLEDEKVKEQDEHPRLKPGEYPDDVPELPESTFDYVSVPPKSVKTIQARFVFAGRIEPMPYPEE